MKSKCALFLCTLFIRYSNAETNFNFPNNLFNSFSLSHDVTKDFGSLCKTHLEVLQSKLKSPFSNPKGIWAINMLNSNGQIPEGMMVGNVYALGNYGSCMNIEVPPFKWNGNQTEGFKGRYLQSYLVPGAGENDTKTRKESGFKLDLRIHSAQTWKTNPFSNLQFKTKDGLSVSSLIIHFGLCLPSSCSDDEMAEVLKSLVNKTPLISQLNFGVFNAIVSQSKADKWILDGLDIFMITLILVLSISIISGTSLEAWYIYTETDMKTKSQNIAISLLLGCSLYRNTNLLLSITKKGSKNSDHLSCINGIRFLSMTWVILGHVYSALIGGMVPSNNTLIFGKKLTDSFAARAILNAYVSVDSFLLLSGCLVTYLTLKELDKTKGTMNLFMFYVHRYLRLTGMYAFVILFHMTLIRGFQGGPNLPISNSIERCRKSWWKHLLYINNLNYKDHYGVDNFNDICIGPSWYLNNDMQMFIVAPIFVYALWYSKLYGLILAGCASFASVMVPLFLTVVNDWPATLMWDSPPTDYYANNYILPWCRFSPYIVGILLGYSLHLTKDKPLKISKEVNVICWGLATALGIAVLYGLNYSGLLTNDKPSQLTNAFYGGFHRFTWGVALAWVVFACSRGYGGWINTFLTWEAFEPLSKLCYNIYLVHASILVIIVGKTSFTLGFSNFLAIVMFFTITVFSILVSTVLFVCVEVPWANTEKTIFSVILGRNSKAKSN